MRKHRNCCGLDVHKQTIAACVISESADGSSNKQKRMFGTMTQQLRELAQWLTEAKVTAVAIEATGVYWMPVWNVLEQHGFELLLINPEHYKADIVMESITLIDQVMSVIRIFQQLSGENRTATATSRCLLTLPYPLRATTVTDQQLVYRRSAVLA